MSGVRELKTLPKLSDYSEACPGKAKREWIGKGALSECIISAAMYAIGCQDNRSPRTSAPPGHVPPGLVTIRDNPPLPLPQEHLSPNNHGALPPPHFSHMPPPFPPLSFLCTLPLVLPSPPILSPHGRSEPF